MVIKILILAAVFITGFVFMYQALYMRYKSRVARQWPTVKGKVLSSGVEEDTLRSSMGKASIVFFPAISYEYKVNGQVLKGTRVVFGSPTYDYITAARICERFPVEAIVDVTYNPANPPEAVLVPHSRDAMRSLIPGIFFLVAGVLISIIMILFR